LLEVLESRFTQDCLEIMLLSLEINSVRCEHDSGNFQAVVGLSHTLFPTVQRQSIGTVLQDLASGFETEPHDF
jgi:hypothetical protein